MQPSIMAASRRIAFAICATVALPGVAPAQIESTRAARAAAVDPAFRVSVAGHGRPMILISGLVSDGAVWDGLVARYRDRYEMHVLTLAGFAGVPPIGASDYATRERDAIVQYVQSHHLEKPIVVGHSFGGFLAYSVASSAPGVVGPVISIDGLPFTPALVDTTATVERTRDQANAVRAAFAQLNGEQLVAQLRPSFSQMMHDTAALTRAMGWARISDPATVGSAMAAMLSTDLRPALAAIASPVLHIAALGAYPAALHSSLVSRYEAQIAAAPHHHLVTADHAFHFVMLDDLDLVVREIDSFIDAARGVRRR